MQLAICLITLTTLPISAQEIAPPPAPTVPAMPATIQDTAPVAPPTQSLSRDDYKSDWRQAGTGANGLGNQLRSHIVRLDDNNALKGKLSVIGGSGVLTPIESVKIRFVRKGEVKAQTAPNQDGSFVVRDLDPGVYSMVAAGSGGFIAWSVNVREKKADIAKRLGHIPVWYQEAKTKLDVQAAAVPPTNFSPLKQLLRQYLPSEDSTLYLEGGDIPDDMLNPPADAIPGTSVNYHAVDLTPDGRLLGRIRRLQPDSGRDLRIRQLNVFLLKDNAIVAQEEVAPNGTFAFEDVSAGGYSMVAAGRDGFLAFSVYVRNARAASGDDKKLAKSGLLPVRFPQGQAGLQIDVALCSPQDFNQQNLAQLTDGFTNDDGAPLASINGGFPPAGGAPAGMPGGGGGIGGGGGGGGVPSGGLGGVLLGGAIGAGVGTILDDDDDQRQQASPSSPQ